MGRYKRIKLSKGYVALVDPEDFERVSQFKWTADVHPHTVYAHRKDDTGTKVYLHHFVLQVVPIKGQIQVDHRNHNGLHNYKKNLRVVTSSQNRTNSRVRVNTLSGYKGVGKTRYGKYRARLGNYHLGNFTTAKDAALAYDTKARELYEKFACLNFPKEKLQWED